MQHLHRLQELQNVYIAYAFTQIYFDSNVLNA